MIVMGVSKFHRFFRSAAGLDVDRNDLKRYNDFIDQKIYDLLLIGQAHAKAHGRDTIDPADLPITKGLQESIHQFRKLDEEIEVEPLLENLVARPPLDAVLSEDAEAELPHIAGGLSCGACPGLRHHRAGTEEPADSAMGTGTARLRSPGLNRPASELAPINRIRETETRSERIDQLVNNHTRTVT